MKWGGCVRRYLRQYLDDYVEEFEKLNIDVNALILFGSHARGEGVLSSDVDIAVVMNEPLSSRERGILRCLGDEINPYIETDLFFTHVQALEGPTHHFDTNTHIKREGIVLWGEKVT